ncbi:MAG: 50S ribosomal protein L10, partial [Clostridia bacterium]|nr:50S ribosomal protein L10 [Clostridia bacterium]
MPSAQVVERKQQIVNDLSDKFKNAQACVIVNYAGITVENDTALRKELTAAGVNYAVIKNTLIKRACENSGYEDLTNVLEGMTAVATSE